MSTLQLTPVQLGYVSVFGVAAALCFVSIGRARRIDHPDTRRGIVWLLALSGVWAATQSARLLIPGVRFASLFYLVGLLVGLATVGAWLYFASAYTGRTHHRDPRWRRLAVGVYVAVGLIKLTNSIHGLYFSITPTTVPFAHATIEQHLVHWAVTGLAYALTAVGFYMLYETLLESSQDTRVLGGLLIVPALPIALNVLGHVQPSVLLQLEYDPLGVAAFAVGTLFIVDESFSAVRSRGHRQVFAALADPALLLDEDGRLREYNRAAETVFPEIGSYLDAPVTDLQQGITDALSDESARPLGISIGEETRYFVVRSQPVTAGPHTIGQAVVLTDITRVERQRRELERQNEQLDDFATAITHELRNPLNVILGRADLLEETLTEFEDHDPAEHASAMESLEVIQRTGRRLVGTIDDLRRMAAQGKSFEEATDCAFEGVIHEAWNAVDHGPVRLEVEPQEGGRIIANRPRLSQLFRYLFEYATRDGSTRVNVRLSDDGFEVSDDGPRPSGDPETLLEYGTAADDGMRLANARMLARVHGWRLSIEKLPEDGMRITVRGAQTDHGGPADGPYPHGRPDSVSGAS